MGKKRNWILRVLLSLLLVLAAALVFLWPFSSHKAKESPAPAESSAPEAAATASPAPVTAAPTSPAEAPAALPAPLPAPTVPPTPAPEDADAEKVRVSELMVKNRATLPDEDGDFPDWLELENVSEETVDLSGWMMRDSEKKPFWVFPELQLAPGERTLLFLSGKDLPGHADFSLSAGETLQILTDLGAPVAELLCPDGETDVAWIPLEDGGVLVLLELETGRTHQIRVHLSAIGCPVHGDFLYGTEDPERFAGRFALHSAYLELKHPVTGERMRFTPVPEWAGTDVLLMDFD